MMTAYALGIESVSCDNASVIQGNFGSGENETKLPQNRL